MVINWIFGGVLFFFNIFDFDLELTPLLETIIKNAIKLAALLAAIYIIGWLISKRWFRSVILRLFSKIPLVSGLTDLFFSHDYVERINSGEFPVVEYTITEGGVSVYGLVTHEEKDWCLVFFPTSPVPFTGYTLKIDKKRLKKTDMNVQDFFRVMVSFGLNVPDKQTKKPSN